MQNAQITILRSLFEDYVNGHIYEHTCVFMFCFCVVLCETLLYLTLSLSFAAFNVDL